MSILLFAGAALAAAITITASCLRWRTRLRRRYVRLLIEPYRSDRSTTLELCSTLRTLHGLLYVRGAARLVRGQASFALECHVHVRADGSPLAWLAICCPVGLERHVQAALRASYPNCALRAVSAEVGPPPAMLCLRRRAPLRASPAPATNQMAESAGRPVVERLLGAMAAAGGASVVQIALAPAPRSLELLRALALTRADRAAPGAERGGRVAERGAGALPLFALGPLLFGDLRVVAGDRASCRAIAAELSAGGATGGLAERPGLRLRGCAGRLARGELGPLPSLLRGVFTAPEIAGLWCLPSADFAGVPFLRRALPLAPAPPGIERCAAGEGVLRDAHGSVTLQLAVRRQNTAVVGAVEQGKSSYLVASVREDLRRERCAVIVLDPKGDAADAAISAVPLGRVCTVLDMAHPSCGFNPLAVDAPPDAVADYVVASLRGLFSDGEVKASSDRYLRNALIAAIVCSPSATLWDVARLLSVGEDGRLSRSRAADRLMEFPEHAEIAAFFSDELPAQLRDARATTTAKLDAPANKLARVINSAAVARVLRNESLRIDFDRVIARSEVLVVRGALGEIGAGNVAVLMQLLLGMLDAALSRVQDRRRGERRAVALKIDEAPLVVNEAFSQTLALKRSAGLETTACWQTDAQWPEELRERLDALFAHRVLFATASAPDARSAASLLMAEYSDQLRAGDTAATRLASPDVRLHLPRHTALVSWTTPAGRERPFLASTLPLAVDPKVLARQRAEQLGRGGRELVEAQPAPAPPPSRGSLRQLQARGAPIRVEQAPPVIRSSPVQQAPTPAQHAPAASQLTQAAVEVSSTSWQELVAVDACAAVRCLPIPPRALGWSHDAQEIEMLAWIVAARCALTSQIHSRFNPSRALTTTQRRLKRLADAGLIARLQLARTDGGRVSLCCAPTQAAFDALEVRKRASLDPRGRTLDHLRGDLHAVGWLLELERIVGSAVAAVLGPGRPSLAAAEGCAASSLSPGERLRPRDFVDERGQPVERFAPVSPLAAAELRLADGDTTDLLLLPASDQLAADLRRYDHLIAGWWRSVPRYARAGQPPTVVVLCAGAAAALSAARTADRVLRACLAELGQPPAAWARPGRRGILIANEQDIHGGSLACLALPATPGHEPVTAALPEPAASEGANGRMSARWS